MKSRRKPIGGSQLVDLQEVERLLDFMATHGLEEFEYRVGDLHIRLKKPGSGTNSTGARIPPQAETASSMAGLPAAESVLTAPPPAIPSPSAQAEDLHVIKSPIVGTFHEASAPGAEPLVRVGDHVDSGQVLCIIEAMKLMNEIESDMAGEVMRIHVQNGQPVEYGEPLFTLRPAPKK